jgi:protein involved in plasmid replication-relaxation
MKSSRLPRFKRTSAVAPMQITERDREIIRLVERFRFVRSSNICSLIPGSPQQLLRRLKLLYHHGFLERPRIQLDYYHHGGSRHIAYGLGNQAAALSKRELGAAFRESPWGEKNGSVKRIFLEHALLVSDVIVAIELACRQAGIRLLTDRELAVADKTTGERRPFRWKVNVTNRMKLGVVPDYVFALDFKDQGGISNRAYFFLEADRATMPVIRKNLSQTSFYRKLRAYEATWSQSIHQTRFGFHRFRVLTITTSAARVKSLIAACSKLERGQGLFLFADRTVLEKPGDMFLPIWQTGREGETVSLLD